MFIGCPVVHFFGDHWSHCNPVALTKCSCSWPCGIVAFLLDANGPMKLLMCSTGMAENTSYKCYKSMKEAHLWNDKHIKTHLKLVKGFNSKDPRSAELLWIIFPREARALSVIHNQGLPGFSHLFVADYDLYSKLVLFTWRCPKKWGIPILPEVSILKRTFICWIFHR